MATEIDPKDTAAGWKPYHFAVDQFLAMIESRIFPEGQHLELLGGILVAKPARTDPHDYVVGAIGEELRRMTPVDWLVREEKSLVIGKRSRPVPDLAVVQGPRSRFGRRAPTNKEAP